MKYLKYTEQYGKENGKHLCACHQDKMLILFFNNFCGFICLYHLNESLRFCACVKNE